MRDEDRKLDGCVKCTDCNMACPVMKVLPIFPGPKTLGPDLERIRKEGISCKTDLLEYCTGCNRCEMVCPNQVNVSEMIANAKAAQPKYGTKALRDYFLARPALLGEICTVAPGMANLLLNWKPNRWLMSKTIGISAKRSFPRYRAAAVRTKTSTQAARRVIFFPGCFIRYNEPSLAQSVVDLLEFYGCEVEMHSAACCGVPASANGDHEATTNNIRKNVERMLAQVQRGVPVITACTSCSHMFKAEYARVRGVDPATAAGARLISRSTYDLAEFLQELPQPQGLKPVEMKLAYHAPCHLKGQGIGRPWLDLLRTIPGLLVDEIPAECCGMSGTYGFKEEKYEISMEIGRELFDGIRAYKPDLAISECGTCRMQIEQGTAITTAHPAEILRNAYGLP